MPAGRCRSIGICCLSIEPLKANGEQRTSMSDSIKHECGVALLRLRKDAAYYERKYETRSYGFQKVALMLEKQHNRGQDGAGIASLHLLPEQGRPCYDLEKSCAQLPLADLLTRCSKRLEEDPLAFRGEVFLGHLRYATFGRHELSACHPFVRESAFLDRLLILAGNFNLTDTHELSEALAAGGHHLSSKADGAVILQCIAHALEHERSLYGNFRGLKPILRNAAEKFDGAFVLCGILGDGSAFALRDANGIRPAYYYFDDEVAVVASERPAIQAAFNCATGEVRELPPGKAMIIHPDGEVELIDCLDPKPRRACVFERIYFSRANDAEIHAERKHLGHALVPQLVRALHGDLENAFVSYIPNSAQVCFHGLLEALLSVALHDGHTVRFGQVAVKDAKFRTFISDVQARKELAMHVYDVTYGLVRPGSDTLIVLDDSIVRGNTMRRAILPILDRLGPKKIIVASSAPPILYPDCYGIDMATLNELVAFNALILCLKEIGREAALTEAYESAKHQLTLPPERQHNVLSTLYNLVPLADLIDAITRLLTPDGLRAEVQVVFQTIDDLHRCCPNHLGDWYFTGDYPTPGGNQVVNRALVNYMENRNERAY